ncbi:hypothetical protein GUJ93_ZPchr0006g42627 [Zizania palustris]|uniref:HMA domain-containing protein n=1 Tax=Zizania palustris TaxID=103762 RepID=A0A8J5SIB4_ZIZPA|nr:hypothetical protein GUJ93_ZPchr0006g42627 [Zizania palustris]
MGKKNKGGGGGEKKEMVLKVAMHCKCKGCIDKIRNAVKDLPLYPGVEAMDQSAVLSKGEVRLVATADPAKLRDRLHKATGKKIDLLILQAAEPQPPVQVNAGVAAPAAAVAAQALLSQLQPVAGAWPNGQISYGAAAQPCPWPALQPAAAEAYYPYYPGASASASAWGPSYGYPHDAYGRAPAWHTHAYY